MKRVVLKPLKVLSLEVFKEGIVRESSYQSILGSQNTHQIPFLKNGIIEAAFTIQHQILDRSKSTPA